MSAHYDYALDPGFKVLLASAGVRHQDVLRRAGLPEDLLNRPNVRVPADQFFAFTHAIQDSVDDPLFPIQLVDNASADSFSPTVFAALCSPDLTVAVTRLAMFKPLIAPVRLDVETSRAGLRITYQWHDSRVGPSPFLIGSEALFVVKLARMGTRHEVRATEVTLPEFPREREAHEAFLGCRIDRGDQLSVCFCPEDAKRPFLTDNSSMWDIFEPQLRKRLADLEGSASFEARTRAVLIEALPSGQVSVDLVAQRLALSSRTLQRRLRDEGTSFKAVVRETRKRLSLYYLEQTQLSYSEIAYLLAFEEPNSFFRAFHGWTGTTPETLRQSLRPNA
ncbi:MAG: AraC family transcriptional regulator ligand-binding domain-containing protein [Myxococcota bacterium]